MMNNNGWIKLYRELLDKAIWKASTAEQKVILITIMLLANHNSNEWEFAGKKFTCNPGQFITSLDSLASACGKGISKQNVRTALVRFEKLDFLTNESTKTGRLITVVNWEQYQGIDCEPNIVSNKDLTKHQQRPNKDLTPNKNERIKECRNNNIYSENPLLNEAIIQFVAFRKQMKKPMTDHAVKLLITKLNNLSPSVEVQVDIINQSIMNGWTNVYPLKNEQQRESRKTKRKEVVPKWLTEQKQDYDFSDIEKRVLANDPALLQRAEDLKRKIAEGG